ncbi:MAG: hypothetical protein HYZ12_03130 [Thaumarchaeota archaeon]|nr:hypothetical protein [Nitrososphaerota archaeon]
MSSIRWRVEELARLDSNIVVVQQGSVVGTAFHPELSGSTLSMSI